uniref:type I DNA topoisomerase n=1 Tax=Schlesneria paludicola TaxID=360056 RepID=UPI00029A5D83|nr:type I DNA topoisomerase [Schlesneria paludicola]
MTEKSMKRLVIVESPAKAKKIGGYLGSNYTVMASMGHVRDLPESAKDIPEEIKKTKSNLAKYGVDVDNEFEPLYIVSERKKKLVKELRDALKGAGELLLATDEDREGESIGWHLAELLAPKVPVKRMVFSEITKEAIQEAVQHTRELDMNLVAAQEARRIIDRLYGYRLSPLLWKKVRPKLSAGRVQSVAVRVLVRRELERLAFRSGSYWDLKSKLATSTGAEFEATLATVKGQRVATGKDFDENTGKLKHEANVVLLDEDAAKRLQTQLQSQSWNVTSVETRMQTRKPYAPFTTSTLQQEANRKLGLTARDTMRIAQSLYEDGYITYMRTDSVNLSQEALNAARKSVLDRYGKDYLSPEPRQYSTKTKNAQEAHEAIRPAGTEMKTAEEQGLSGREAALYGMIWKRTVATQMAEAQLRFQTVTVTVDDAEFKATGRHVEFPGFFRAYVEGVDDPEAALDDQEAALPPLNEQDRLALQALDPIGHETKPPARYTEATLVKALEADGIGRPSTYATIIDTIIDREYVMKAGSQLVPTFTAFAVNQLLETYFPKLVDLGFTAKMEQDLDDIANGQGDRLPYLQQFYNGSEGLDAQVKANEEAIDPRSACTLQFDGLNSKIRVGKFGPYLESEKNGETITASIPDSLAPADITNAMVDNLIELKQRGPQSLGEHPETGLPIFLLVGPFGPYLQLGEKGEDGTKPKRVSLPKTRDPNTITLDDALSYLALPRQLGKHPTTDHVVNAGIGMYGPYVKHEKTFKSLEKTDDVLTITMERAIELLAQAKVKAVVVPIKELGPHPEDKEPVQIFDGRYGAYVKHGKVNATLPKGTDPQAFTLEEALPLLAERAARGPAPKKSRGRATKAASTKVAAEPKEKKAVKKKAAKKATKKKAVE